MHVSSQFVSIGVNRIVNALDWGDTGLIAYGGHSIVCIYDPEAAEVVGTLTGHKGQVNCVKWLPASVCPAGVSLLLSGAADNSIRLWAWLGKAHSPPWLGITELQAHQSPVTSLALHQLDASTLLLASTSGDPQLQLWQCSHGSSSSDAAEQPHHHQQQQQCSNSQELQARFGAAAWQHQPPVHVGTQIQHCVALASLPEDEEWLVMATGGTDSSIRLFVRGPGRVQGPADGAAAVQQSVGFRLQCQLKGHENWVRGVVFTQVQEAAAGAAGGQQRVSLLLASAAQDRYGRVWRITTDASNTSSNNVAATAAAAAAAAAGSAGEPDVVRQLITRYAPRPHLSTPHNTYWVSLEALLVGHEDWLHSLSWRPVAAAAAAASGAVPAAAAAAAVLPTRQDLTLLTTSQDRSMMLWSYDAPTGLWLSEAAVGDAGATCLGFYGGAFSPRGDWLVAHGFTGALHLWKQQQQQQQQEAVTTAAAAAAGGGGGGTGLIVSGSSSGSSSRRCSWVPQHALGGHYGAVVDLAWGADGGCVQSVGTDQTARLFTGCGSHWFELARTQVHGHDFSCMATIPTPAAAGQQLSSNRSSSGSGGDKTIQPSLLYVSGSEEKMLRVFEAPQAFIDTLTVIRSRQSAEAAAAVAAALAAAREASGSGSSSSSSGTSWRGRAVGASVSALGLSNKALYVEDQADGGDGGAGGKGSGFGAEAYNEGPDFVPCATPGVVTGPPLEEHLAQNTLWPEVRKLYGHGNDVFCVCSSPNGRIIASACRAQSAGAASVWVWEVGSWRPVTELSGHTLTVTQLEFSPDGRFLLSGSRDRSFSVWRVAERFVQPVAAAAAGAGSGDVANNAAGAAGAAAAAGGGGEAFELVVRLPKAHSRIIWGVSWSHDSRFFATGSRDQMVKLWAIDGYGQLQQKPIASLPAFSAGVTAVALAPQHVAAAAAAAGGARGAGGVHLLAVGLEDGQVQVWSADVSRTLATGGDAGSSSNSSSAVHVEQLWVSQPWEQHAATVRRLKWAPEGVDWLCGGSSGACVQLASCGEDHSVRVYRVQL